MRPLVDAHQLPLPGGYWNMIRVLIVDDEPHARQKLSHLVLAAGDLELLGT